MEVLELVIVIHLGLLGGLRSGQVEAKIVHTSSGMVQGFEDAGTHQFLGIPFAEAPIGERRFKRPVWKTRMPGTYNASYFRPRCPQMLVNNPIVDPNDKMEEDCLYLNIYTPLDTSVTSPKTVMVWIHGGSFTMGSGQDYPGTMLALRNDVVVVNTNYRLGALGFLSTMDNNAVGNLGLWDQTMALEWVKVNIAAFGGNPDSVTVFGESAGSASVTLLALSPFTEGLFRRVIAQSGSAFSSWSISPDPLKASRDLGKRLGCPSATNEILIRCLRHQSVQDIVESQHLITPGNAFTAALGTEFLPFSPTELITTHKNSTVARKLAEVDFLIGQNTDEAASFFKPFLAPVLDVGELVDDFTGISQKIFDTFMANSLISYTQGDSNLAQKLVAPFTFMYTDWTDRQDGITRSEMLIKFLADSMFTVSVVQFARAHALLRQHWNTSAVSESGTFMYLYDHRGSWMPMEPWRSGADHADEIPFVFGLPLTGIIPNITDEEKQLSDILMRYWTNFAKTGDPNDSAAGSRLVKWPRFEVGTERYLRLHTGMMSDSVGQRVYNNRVEFWLDYLPKQMNIFQQEPIKIKCS